MKFAAGDIRLKSAATAKLGRHQGFLDTFANFSILFSNIKVTETGQKYQWIVPPNIFAPCLCQCKTTD
jgi:hypothetical protein